MLYLLGQVLVAGRVLNPRDDLGLVARPHQVIDQISGLPEDGLVPIRVRRGRSSLEGRRARDDQVVDRGVATRAIDLLEGAVNAAGEDSRQPRPEPGTGQRPKTGPSTTDPW